MRRSMANALLRSPTRPPRCPPPPRSSAPTVSARCWRSAEALSTVSRCRSRRSTWHHGFLMRPCGCCCRCTAPGDCTPTTLISPTVCCSSCTRTRVSPARSYRGFSGGGGHQLPEGAAAAHRRAEGDPGGARAAPVRCPRPARIQLDRALPHQLQLPV
nr:uncharacterized protein LOC127314158 isoform X2 [Lolium perenne]